MNHSTKILKIFWGFFSSWKSIVFSRERQGETWVYGVGVGARGRGTEAGGGGCGGWHDTLCMYEGFFIELSAMYVIGSVHKWGCVVLPRISLFGPPLRTLNAAEQGWASITNLKMVGFNRK